MNFALIFLCPFFVQLLPKLCAVLLTPLLLLKLRSRDDRCDDKGSNDARRFCCFPSISQRASCVKVRNAHCTGGTEIVRRYSGTIIVICVGVGVFGGIEVSLMTTAAA